MKKQSNLGRLLDYAGKYRILTYLSWILSTVSALIALLPFWYIWRILREVIETAPRYAQAVHVTHYGWMAVLFAVLAVLIYIAGLMCSHLSAFRIATNLRLSMTEHIATLPLGAIEQFGSGRLRRTILETSGAAETYLAHQLPDKARAMATIAGLLALLAGFDWRLGLLAIAGILAYLGVTELSQRAMLKTGPARQHAQMNLVEAVLEYIQGMSVVKSYGLDKDSGQAVQRTVDESCDKALSLEKSVVPWMGLRQVVVRVFSVAIAVCALAFYSGGTLSLARCLLMLVASFMLYAELESAGNMADNLQMLGASMDKANSIDDTPVMDIDGAELTPADTSVEFQDVSFAYGDRTILDHVSLTVPSGSITAVVGPSGGGKTTLCNLIARFWDVEGGRVTIGGRDVREYTLESLMNQVSMVFQRVYLFHDTIENNIKFGCPNATHAQVVEAARKACCHDFISALPDGYDTVIGEGGATLSGGEKQRISIARCLLKDAPIVIFDEATANVDPENEDQLQKAMEALTREKTVLMIAHRLKTVRNADQILVLDQGRIVQQGTHEDLIAQEGIYRDFVSERTAASKWTL